MSDLEEIGYITHPHTSAGRIPTQKGYRYYIDTLMQAKLLNEEERRFVNREFKIKVSELNNLLAKTSKILSSITNQTGVVLFPVLRKRIFKHVELISLGNRKMLVIFMTESGLTEDFIIDMNNTIEQADLSRISNFINSQMGKGSLASIRREIMKRLLAERNSFFYVLEQAKVVIDILLNIVKENRLYLDGRAHLAEHPEFRDADKLRHIFRSLEDEDFLQAMLERDVNEEGVRVYIGSEIDNDTFSECSLITCNYSSGDTTCGTLGVIGPTRMEYSKMVSMVKYVASTLSGVLTYER